MIDGKILVEKLLKYAKTFLYLNARDEIYFRNILLREFNLDEPCENVPDLSYIENLTVTDEIVKEVEDFAKENNMIGDGEENLYSTYIMGILSPLPSEVSSLTMVRLIINSTPAIIRIATINAAIIQPIIGFDKNKNHIEGCLLIEID